MAGSVILFIVAPPARTLLVEGGYPVSWILE